MNFACFTALIGGFIVYAVREINDPKFVYFANLSREERKSILVKRIVLVLGAWFVGLLIFLYAPNVFG